MTTWPRELNPSAIATIMDFGAQLEVLRRASHPHPTYDKVLRSAFKHEVAPPKYGAMRNWFQGNNLPRDFEQVRSLVIWLAQQASLDDQETLVETFRAAYETLSAKRHEEQQKRAGQARSYRDPVAAAPVMTEDAHEGPTSTVPSVREPSKRWWRHKKVLVVAAAGLVLGVLAGVGLASWVGQPPSLMSFGSCGEGIKPNPAMAFQVVVYDFGPSGVSHPNRKIEMRTQPLADGAWLVWAHLEPSASNLDRLWLEWSYDERPADSSRWRQCGPQPITAGAQTPGVLARDAEGHRRWFKACGQVPEQEWLPGRTGSFCTGWTRPTDV